MMDIVRSEAQVLARREKNRVRMRLRRARNRERRRRRRKRDNDGEAEGKVEGLEAGGGGADADMDIDGMEEGEEDKGIGGENEGKAGDEGEKHSRVDFMFAELVFCTKM